MNRKLNEPPFDSLISGCISASAFNGICRELLRRNWFPRYRLLDRLLEMPRAVAIWHRFRTPSNFTRRASSSLRTGFLKGGCGAHAKSIGALIVVEFVHAHHCAKTALTVTFTGVVDHVRAACSSLGP